MLESVTVYGPFSVAAIARACRHTLASVVEPDGRSHRAHSSAARPYESRPMGKRSRERLPGATRRALLDSRPACKEGSCMDPTLWPQAPNARALVRPESDDLHERQGTVG